MHKSLTVARKEYAETVKTKIFAINAFILPVVMIGVILFIARAEKKMSSGPRPDKTILVADLSGELLPELEPLFQKHNESNPKRRILIKPYKSQGNGIGVDSEAIARQVRKRDVDAGLVIPVDVLDGGGRPRYFVRGEKTANRMVQQTVQRLFNDAVVARRCVRRNLSPQTVAKIRKWVSVDRIDVTAKPGEKQGNMGAKMMVPFFFMFMIFMGVFGVNQQMLTSVIEEKNSRVMEVLLSAVSPFEFMAGKILGLAGVGLTTVAIWASAAYGAAAYRGVEGLLTAASLGYFLIYYVLGFLLFSSLFAAIGAACNTIKEAQGLMMPVTLPLMAPMIGWFYFAQNPESFWAVALSFIPPMTPMMMMLRLAAQPDLPMLQVAASIVVLAASVPLAIWASAKIFRTGILMYGKPPTPREMLRWIRYK